MNELKNVTSESIHCSGHILLNDMNIKCTTTWGPLSGFYYHGQSGIVTHSWGVYGVPIANPSGFNLPRGSYLVVNSAMDGKSVAVLVNSAPYEVENQIGAMLDYRDSANVRVNMFKIDSNDLGDGAQRYAGFSCTIFGPLHKSIITEIHDKAHLVGTNNFNNDTNIVGQNNINYLSNDSGYTKLYNNSILNSGLLAYGEILPNNGGFIINYCNPNLTLTYEALGGGGHHKIYTNLPHKQFTCNASHVFSGADDNICQVYQQDGTIELRSRYGRNNDGWVSKSIFWGIYGII